MSGAACTQPSNRDALYELERLAAAFGAVADLLVTDMDLQKEQRDGVSTLLSILNECLEETLARLRNP